jgi:hypothetical protein
MSNQYKVLKESWDLYVEKLSTKEKERRRKKNLYPGYVADDETIPTDMKRMANGIISDANDCHSREDGKFSDCTDVGSYSYDGKQGERSGKNKGPSQVRCGRLKRADGHKYKCHDGSLREDEETKASSPEGEHGPAVDAAYLKATIQQAVRSAVSQALKNVSQSTGCSVNTCARMINTLNKSERGKLNDKPKKK